MASPCCRADVTDDVDQGDDLPLNVSDLPADVRLAIDEIIRNNADLESQMDAIDELIFGGTQRPSDPDVESGIDMDFSGSITSSEFAAMTSSTRDPTVNLDITGSDDLDEFLARMIVQPPPQFTAPEVGGTGWDPAFLPPPVLPMLPELSETKDGEWNSWTLDAAAAASTPEAFSDVTDGIGRQQRVEPQKPVRTRVARQTSESTQAPVAGYYPPIAPKPTSKTSVASAADVQQAVSLQSASLASSS